MSEKDQLPSEGDDSPVHGVDDDAVADELGPRPTPTAESPELFPGGVDAVRDEDDLDSRGADAPPRDPSPEENPATEDSTPEGVKEADDKKQEPDEDPDEESPAEPPA